MTIVITFGIGLVIGALIKMIANLIIDEKSILNLTSWKELNYKMLIPIFQWRFILDRNKEVLESIVLQVIMGTIAMLLYSHYGLTIRFGSYTFFSVMLLLIGFIDFKTTYVYRSTTLITAIGGLILISLESFQIKLWPIDALFGSLIGSVVIGLIVWLTGGMGEGDLEIAALCGLAVGIKGILLTLFIRFVAGGLAGMTLLALKIKEKKDEMAFGPYLVFGCFTAMIWGQTIIDTYLRIISIS